MRSVTRPAASASASRRHSASRRRSARIKNERLGSFALSAMIRFVRLLGACFLLALLPLGAARAQLTIEIVGGAGTQIPVSIVPFDGESNYPLGISGIVDADLQRSGLF